MSNPKTNIALFLALMAPGLANANVGVPMLALAWPAQWLSLIPIIAFECELIRRALDIPFNKMLWPVTKANLVSTAVGVPVAWLIMLSPLMAISYGYSLLPPSTEIPDYIRYLLFPLTSAWVSGSSAWQVYLAFTFLAIPFCLISIFLEKGVIIRFFPNHEKEIIKSTVVRANVWSYILLSSLAIVFPLIFGQGN